MEGVLEGSGPLAVRWLSCQLASLSTRQAPYELLPKKARNITAWFGWIQCNRRHHRL